MSRVPLPVWTAHRICPLCESTCGLELTVGGVSANDLTDESVIDVLSGNAVFNGVPVTLD